ncbi:hypothetical protein FA95DRAFT_1607921 [Auriscalpium vulgare]|uniref:Uncharacterized protein n=1 Tax=Auriscalpium vulgare TaxID=40419 RepID=A0ACB8RMQ2_9AGAM|nr:hypothetical protein FA95DRAFT_1607921 [Auriscalpium vulgare]
MSASESKSPLTDNDHLLPAPSSEHDVPKLDTENGSASLKYDALGPIVINSDGTLSRITNWPSMTSAERTRTFRVLLARNQIRLTTMEEIEKQGAASEQTDAK